MQLLVFIFIETYRRIDILCSGRGNKEKNSELSVTSHGWFSFRHLATRSLSLAWQFYSGSLAGVQSCSGHFEFDICTILWVSEAGFWYLDFFFLVHFSGYQMDHHLVAVLFVYTVYFGCIRYLFFSLLLDWELVFFFWLNRKESFHLGEQLPGVQAQHFHFKILRLREN